MRQSSDSKRAGDRPQIAPSPPPITFCPKLCPKILKIFVNLYQLQYWVAMI